MWSKTFAAAAFSALAACGPRPAVQCPPVVEYDLSFMGRLADELEGLPSGSAVARAVVDYRQLRDMARACRS